MSTAGKGFGQGVLGKPPDVAGFQRVCTQAAAHRPALEDERVERKASGAQAQAVEDRDQPDWFGEDPGLLLDLFDHDLSGRIADVGPSGRV
jgi:hypothetical protein